MGVVERGGASRIIVGEEIARVADINGTAVDRYVIKGWSRAVGVAVM